MEKMSQLGIEKQVSQQTCKQLKKVTDLVILTNLNSLLGDKQIKGEKNLTKENKIKFGQERG